MYDLHPPLNTQVMQGDCDPPTKSWWEGGISEYMEMSHFVTNRFQARCKLLYLVGIAIFNAYFISYSTYLQLYVHNDGDAIVVVFIFEFCVVFALLLRTLIMLLGVSIYESAYLQAFSLVQSLQAAGSFSLFWFMPLPSKMMYWYNNKTFFIEEFILDPPDTCLHWVRGRPQFNPLRQDHWQELHKKAFKESRVLCVSGAPFVFLGWLFTRVVLPMLVFFCVVFAFPVAVIKLSTLPDKGLNDLSNWQTVPISVMSWTLPVPIVPKEWSLSDYFMAAGLLNQIAKIWSPQHIEFVGFLRHVGYAMGEDVGNSWGSFKYYDSGRAFKYQMILCTFREFYTKRRLKSEGKLQPLLDVLSFFAVLDIGTIGKVLNRGIKDNTADYGLHHLMSPPLLTRSF